MELPPLGVHYNNAMTTQPQPDLNRTPTYPVAYFLCDGVTDAKTLKTALCLTRTPKLRKARISGYRRSVRSGDGASTLAFGAYNFGEWSGEEVVKGVVFEAMNLEEERELIKYVGGTGEVKQVEMEVACPSLLGMVGKMMRVGGRIFVPEGDGDTLVGSMRSFVHGEGRLEPEEMDMVVRNGRPVEGTIVEQEDGEDDFSETSSMAVVDGYLTPRISPSISTLNDTDVPHQSLDELPLAAIDEYLEPQIHEHPDEPQIETKDWAATNEAKTTEITEIKDIEDTRVFKAIMEAEESKTIEAVAEISEIETTPVKDIKETKVYKELMGTEDPEKVGVIEEAQETDDTAEIEQSNDMEEIGEIDEIDEARDTQLETEYQRFLLAEHRRARAVSMNTFTSSTTTKIDEEATAPASATQPWTPSIPWRKEHAIAPVRPVLTARTPSQFSGTTTRMRKTSDSIKSLVEKFENMSPQNTPSKGT